MRIGCIWSPDFFRRTCDPLVLLVKMETFPIFLPDYSTGIKRMSTTAPGADVLNKAVTLPYIDPANDAFAVIQDENATVRHAYQK
jgi:hypothetical protein